MTINKEKNGSELVLTLEGRLDTTTAPMLEKELKQEIGGVNLLIMNFAGVEYISSAGLRVLLAAQKVMNRQGQMIIRNVNDTIADIFEITGFSDVRDDKFLLLLHYQYSLTPFHLSRIDGRYLPN